MLLPHYSMFEWNNTRWSNFSAVEMSCPCCGEIYVDTTAFDRIQMFRTLLDRPVYLNSVHRCWKHNAMVGGKPLSMHKSIAFDVSILNHSKDAIIAAYVKAGFTGKGYYKRFIHVDNGRTRFWYGVGGRSLWIGYLV